eukprot:365459-Chlamydomonas_euryale.AAC.5
MDGGRVRVLCTAAYRPVLCMHACRPVRCMHGALCVAKASRWVGRAVWDKRGWMGREREA